jgi:hypothetical protein
MAKAIVMAANDNVATALENIGKGRRTDLIVKGREEFLPPVTARENIPYGNKLALADLAPGDPMIKYGAVCGTVTRHIFLGQFVHVHNVRSERIVIPEEIIRDILKQMRYYREHIFLNNPNTTLSWKPCARWVYREGMSNKI